MLTRDFVLLPLIPVLLVAAGLSVKRQFSFWNTLLLLVFVSYVAGVVAATMFPLPIDARLIADETRDGFLHNSLVPFATIANSFRDGPRYFLLQVVGNLALLVPLGLLLPLLWAPAQRFRTCAAAIVFAALVIEAAQLAVSFVLGYTYRQADIDDLLMNVVGGLMGYACYSMLRLGARRWARFRGRQHAGPYQGSEPPAVL